MKLAIFFSGLAGLSAVVLGAVTSHLGPDSFSVQQIAWMDTAIKYQIWHGVALLGIACLSEIYDSRLLRIAGFLFIIGIILFSGSLYLLALTGITALGMATPFGGSCFILGWALCCISSFKISSSKR